jgi:glucan biosynthesis protein C
VSCLTLSGISKRDTPEEKSSLLCEGRKMNTNQNRLIFFDNLRYLMVLLVLVFHSGASYGSIVAFWPYHDPNPTEVVDLLLMILDVFMMSILFFIAGYFALPSLRKKGGRRFLGDRFKRLGIPWLVVTILVLPVLDYIHYYTQSISRGFRPGIMAHICG